MLNVISLSLLTLVGCSVAYLYTLLVASIRMPRRATRASDNRLSFAAAIPAHNEALVIGKTITMILAADYPRHWIDVYVVADHCTDNTAQMARQAGAFAFERQGEERGGKGAAMSWLLKRIFETGKFYDAVVIFDADTQVDPNFFQIMSARLASGAKVIQGNHIISNPYDGWFPALTWAMFLVDNRIQNLGRSNLGWSAKNMGDSICFRAELLREWGWGEGLTEDYELRQKLLLRGIKIVYEPAAKGYGEAAVNWAIARRQRERWLSGTYRASRTYARRMLREGLRRLDLALLDGAAQAYLPSYSTLTLIAGALFAINLLASSFVERWLVWAWGVLVASLFLYPLFGLMLERAPRRAYFAISLGPVFIVWRTWLSIVARFSKQVVWVRTARRNQLQS